MVMHLPEPDFDSVAFLDLLVDARLKGKNKLFFESIRQEWRERTERYIEFRGSPEHVPSWPDILHNSGVFLNLYASPALGTLHHGMLKTLDAHLLTMCPACGEPGRPNTLDHYLPKTQFPHFCVTPHNLFPMCDACQTEKGSKTGDAEHPRFFIHPYFDVFAAQQVLHLRIQAPYDPPAFKIVPSPHLSSDETRLVDRHLRELDIGRRYQEYCVTAFPRLVRLCASARQSGQSVPDSLQLFADHFVDPSPNGWDHVLYSAAIGDPGFLDYLTNGPIPPYP
ncbi:MAG: hypothetical protein P0Y65_16990 [Candidatus Devosia phytovorans]|uniref:HNH endonuclease n=1 Tax=Candidatus Devosia phytovorans TaxID=3121372 RepID=A0AAJ5VS89_9HYPH|nr:hypothetical protein [Devosia sp.]WEK03868.1 MAG: hypothetical protein P0Y65_16990 [Devosia sp.]